MISIGDKTLQECAVVMNNGTVLPLKQIYQGGNLIWGNETREALNSTNFVLTPSDGNYNHTWAEVNYINGSTILTLHLEGTNNVATGSLDGVIAFTLVEYGISSSPDVRFEGVPVSGGAFNVSINIDISTLVGSQSGSIDDYTDRFTFGGSSQDEWDNYAWVNMFGRIEISSASMWLTH